MTQTPYHIINRVSENGITPEAVHKRIGIIAREPLATGLLSGKYSVGSKFHKKTTGTVEKAVHGRVDWQN